INTTARNAVFAVSENAQRLRGRVSVFRDPAVSETGVIFDMVETRVDIAELLADTLDERAHIGAIPFRAVPGDEIFAVDEIVDLTVADVLAGLVDKIDRAPFECCLLIDIVGENSQKDNWNGDTDAAHPAQHVDP